SYYLRKLGLEQLQSAVAQADALDPGWRWEDLEKKRAIIPDAENAALRVQAAHKLLPRDWLKEEPADGEEPSERTILEEIQDLQPPVQLDEEQIAEARARLKRIGPALSEARLLAGMRTGRYPPAQPEDALSLSKSDWFQHPRALASLLWLDAALLAQDQKLDAALASGRALLNSGRSIGDEPFMLCLFVRIACQRLAILSSERTLGQGQAPQDALAATQRLFAD